MDFLSFSARMWDVSVSQREVSTCPRTLLSMVGVISQSEVLPRGRLRTEVQVREKGTLG